MPPMSLAASPPRLSTLILLAALSILPVNMFLPSLAHIAGDFQVDYALASLAIAGYAVVAAVLQLVMPPLSDRFGRRPLALAGLAVFVVASVGCALAQDIGTFLTFRLLQAVVASGHAMALAAIRDSTDPQQAASRIGYVAMAWSLAPMLGPTFGGLLDELLGWRSIFWVFALAGAAVFVLCLFDLRETNLNRSASLKQQFLNYPALFGSRLFWACALCMTFSVGTFYAFLSGSPLVAAAVFDMSPAVLGFFMGTITGGFMLGSFLSGRYAGRFPLTTNMIFGRIAALAGLATGLALQFAGVGHVMAFFGPCMLVGLGNGITLPSANSRILSVQPGLAGSAAGLAGSMTVAGGAVAASLTGAVMTEESGALILLSTMLVFALASLWTALRAHMLARGSAAP